MAARKKPEGHMMNFHALFEPKTMAVIGVSLTNGWHPANVIFTKNHLRYPVRVFPVNLRGGELRGEKVYTSLAEIPERIDLAIIAVKAEQVPHALDECIRSKAKAVVVISGGFAESGRRDLQEQIADMASKARLPLLGPNCLGIYTPEKVDTFFLPSERMVLPEPGGVTIVSQSGGVLVDLMIKFAGEGVGLAHAISIGNKAVIRESDLLAYLGEEDRTKVISFYVEGFGKEEGRSFVRAAAECPKPVIVLKAGKSPGGSRAIASHTASLSGDYAVFSEVLAQHGVVEARNEVELISFCEARSCYQKNIKGNIAIVTVSGGHGALAVDACTAQDLAVPALPVEIQKELRAMLSPSIQQIAALANPIDLTGSAVDADLMTVTSYLSKLPTIDCILLLILPYLPGTSSDLGALLSQIYLKEGKPLIAYLPHVEKYRMLIEGFELNRLPVSPSIEGAVLMAKVLRR
jgi:acyl-CoA synthetase (NDP forming)